MYLSYQLELGLTNVETSAASSVDFANSVFNFLSFGIRSRCCNNKKFSNELNFQHCHIEITVFFFKCLPQTKYGGKWPTVGI